MWFTRTRAYRRYFLALSAVASAIIGGALGWQAAEWVLSVR